MILIAFVLIICSALIPNDYLAGACNGVGCGLAIANLLTTF